MTSDSTTVAIGSGQDYIDGSAYIFTYTGNTWTQQVKLVPNDMPTDFGYLVAVSADGNTTLVGTLANYDLVPDAVYVFTRNGNTWTQQAKLTSDVNVLGFGTSLAVSTDGNIVFVSNPEEVTGSVKGAVYHFTRNAGVWTQHPKLIPSDGPATPLTLGSILALSRVYYIRSNESAVRGYRKAN